MNQSTALPFVTDDEPVTLVGKQTIQVNVQTMKAALAFWLNQSVLQDEVEVLAVEFKPAAAGVGEYYTVQFAAVVGT